MREIILAWLLGKASATGIVNDIEARLAANRDAYLSARTPQLAKLKRLRRTTLDGQN